MYAQARPLSAPPRSLSLGAAVAINGGLIAALLFANPEIVTRTIPVFTVRSIPLDPPPPPLPDPVAQPKVTRRSAARCGSIRSSRRR